MDSTKTILLASFINRNHIGRSLRLLKEKYKIYNNTVYVLNNKSDFSKLILTYNVIIGDDCDNFIDFSSVLKNTINIHRKKSTNTLYTINALNEIIAQNNGSRDIDWSEYEKCLLLTQKDSEDKLSIINTSLNNIVDLEKVSLDVAEDDNQEFDKQVETDDL